MLRKTIYQVEMEIAEELWIVGLYHKNYSQRCFIEFSKRFRHWLSNKHVSLEESEQVHNEVLELKPLLVEGCINLLHLR